MRSLESGGVIPAPPNGRSHHAENVEIGVSEYRADRGGRRCSPGHVLRRVALAHSGNSHDRNSLEGAWLVRVTLRACDTNASLGSFLSLVSFHDGGTISETTTSSAFAIGQPSPGQGVWKFEGRRTYHQRMIALIDFDTAPNLPGTPGFNPALPGDTRVFYRLVHRHAHPPAHRRRSRQVVRYERVLQGRWNPLQNGVLDRGRDAIRVSSWTDSIRGNGGGSRYRISKTKQRILFSVSFVGSVAPFLRSGTSNHLRRLKKATMLVTLA